MINEVIRFIRDFHNLDNEEISKDSYLVADLGLESYNVIEMCCAIEEHFSIFISENDISKLETVGDIVNYIHNYRQKSGSLLT